VLSLDWIGIGFPDEVVKNVENARVPLYFRLPDNYPVTHFYCDRTNITSLRILPPLHVTLKLRTVLTIIVDRARVIFNFFHDKIPRKCTHSIKRPTVNKK